MIQHAKYEIYLVTLYESENNFYFAQIKGPYLSTITHIEYFFNILHQLIK